MIKRLALVWDMIAGQGKPMLHEDLEAILEIARDRICEREGIAIAGVHIVTDDDSTHEFFLKCCSPRYPYSWQRVSHDICENIAEYDYLVAIECDYAVEQARAANVPRMDIRLGPYRTSKRSSDKTQTFVHTVNDLPF